MAATLARRRGPALAVAAHGRQRAARRRQHARLDGALDQQQAKAAHDRGRAGDEHRGEEALADRLARGAARGAARRGAPVGDERAP